MKEIMKLGIILLIICLVSAALLAFTYDITKLPIDEQREKASQQSRKDVLPDAESFEVLEEDLFSTLSNDKIVEVYKGLKGTEIIGYVIKTVPAGYGGEVEVITGISTEGKVTGVRVGTHQETPGLGANATLPYFYEQYEGMSTDISIGVSKTEQSESEIKAIAGATITSWAVTTGVNYSIEAVDELSN